ncbi:MAG: hypothetical protein V1749_08990 [Candidatus Desantisbacteria bacterium]
MILKDAFKKIEIATEWSVGSRYDSHCYLCHKREATTCLTEKGRLCADCVASELKKIATSGTLTEWTFPQIIHVLNSPDNIRWRLMLLWRFKEVLQIVEEKSPADVDALLSSLMYNLRDIHRHPLSLIVGQAAMDACIGLGKRILPLLLQSCKPEPWEFYVNIISSCVAIDAEDERVQNLIQKAADHSNPMVRKYVVNSIADHSFSWGEEILESLANDNKKEVSALAAKVISSLNISNLRRAIISKGIAEAELVKIEEMIDKDYNLDTLKKICKQYLQYLFKNDKIPQKKVELVCAFATVFADKDLFQGFLSSLSDDVKKVLQLVVWDGERHSIAKLEKMFKIKIVENNEYNRTKFCDDYLIFRIQQEYYYRCLQPNQENGFVSLSDGLRKIIKKHLPLPEEYEMRPLDTIKKTDFIHENNVMILRQINLFVAYIKQGNLRFAKNQTKVMKSSVKEMARCCSIKEFYDDDKDLEYIKTQLIIDFLSAASIERISDPIKGLKQLFDSFFNYKELKKYQLRNLLFHLKGDANYYYYNYEQQEEKVRLSLFNLLKAMSDYHWYAVENVITYCGYRDIDLNLVDRAVANRYLYYNKIHNYGYERIMISEGIYKDALIIPLIKSAMFLFSTFGLVDIAYNLPENPFLQEKEHKYLSVFDGLQYIKLTKLGAFVLGLTKEYTTEGIEEQKANLILDESRLLIHMEGEDMLKRLALEKIGEKMSNAHYRVDYNSFLKECFCEKDIQQKITLFKDYISSKPPQIWQNFLDGILKKINPLTIENEVTVYKLTPDKELISLIATDEMLKKYILKAEDYRILIKAVHINKIKKRLGELGYFVDHM